MLWLWSSRLCKAKWLLQNWNLPSRRVAQRISKPLLHFLLFSQNSRNHCLVWFYPVKHFQANEDVVWLAFAFQVGLSIQNSCSAVKTAEFLSMLKRSSVKKWLLNNYKLLVKFLDLSKCTILTGDSISFWETMHRWEASRYILRLPILPCNWDPSTRNCN